MIDLKDISRVYQMGSEKVYALNKACLHIDPGEFVSIIGKSGSGKSTLLHILSGLDRPNSGRILVNGKDLCTYTDEQMSIFRRRHMGFVFQQYNLLEEYNVLTNICMPLKLDGQKPDSQFLDEITELLGLTDKLKKYPGELSGGEQQRVAIARSILAKPQLIFADEPTGNLDKKTGEDTLNLLKSCARRFGQTLIMVTHDLEIARQADRLIHIEDGKILDLKES